MQKISIIVPIYNVEKYLYKCLDSLINQTYKNIEIICINDGSLDNSQNILEEYKLKDSRIIVVQQENKGVSAARNLGLSLSTGSYVLFVDADDWLELKTCEDINNALKNNDADLINFHIVSISDNIYRKQKIRFPYKNHIEMYKNLLPGGFTCVAYKNEFLRCNNIKFPEGMIIAEDLIFMLNIFALKPKELFLDEYFYYCRADRENSATKDYEKTIINLISAAEYFSKTETYNGLSSKEKLYITDYWAKGLFHLWSKIVDKTEKKRAESYIVDYLQSYKKYQNYFLSVKYVGYRRIKYRYLYLILKSIRSFYFFVKYRK